jgi:tetratricopeptide (TPR) repeat protein
MKNSDIRDLLTAIHNAYSQKDYHFIISKVSDLSRLNIYQEKIYEYYSHAFFSTHQFSNCVVILNLMEQKGHLFEGLSEMKAECFFYLGEFAKAAEIYERQLFVDPGNETVRRKVIYSLLRSSQTEKAYEFYLNKSILGRYQSKIGIVIPVLDMSPSTPGHNILGLLDDLTELDAEVTVIFNNTEIGLKLKDHPRINHFAILSENVGVSRAWNIGIDISRSEFTAVLNADLRLKPQVILDLVSAIESDDKVAMSGPQGCLGDLNLNGKEISKLIKGEFIEIKEVDLVMGFMFAVRTDLFHSGILKFDNHLTPAFSEEIDISRQIKKAKMKIIAVPTVDFDHGGSGSHLSNNQIQFYDQSEIKLDIMNRNDCYLYQKWFCRD